MIVKDEMVLAINFLETLRPQGLRDWALVGSAAWMPDPADIDFIVRIENPVGLYSYLTSLGWQDCDKIGVYEMQGEWMAVRKGNINLLLTADRDWMTRMIQATEVCKYLRLTDKSQRVAVNQIIRDGKLADDFLPLVFEETKL